MCLFACLLFEALRFHDPLSFCLPFIFFCLKIFAALQSIVVVCTLYSVHITLTCRCFFSIYTYSCHLIFNTNSTMRNSLPIELLLADNKEKEKTKYTQRITAILHRCTVAGLFIIIKIIILCSFTFVLPTNTAFAFFVFKQ